MEPLDTRTGWWWRNPSSSRTPGLGTRLRPRSGARSDPWMLRARAPGTGREVPKVRARNRGGLRPAPSQPPGASASPDRPFAPLPGSRGWRRAPARLTWSAAARRREPGGGREAAAAARAGVRGAQRVVSGSCGRPDPPPHPPPPRPLPRAGRSVCFPRPTDVGQNIGHMVAAINWGRAQTLSASMALSAATRPAGGRGRADGGCCEFVPARPFKDRADFLFSESFPSCRSGTPARRLSSPLFCLQWSLGPCKLPGRPGCRRARSPSRNRSVAKTPENRRARCDTLFMCESAFTLDRPIQGR